LLIPVAFGRRLRLLPEYDSDRAGGFASVPAANPVTPEGQRSKLEMVVRLAPRVWG
jgi:hypothetical protein